jgi:hypothetical protein
MNQVEKFHKAAIGRAGYFFLSTITKLSFEIKLAVLSSGKES